jgi:class 3 adenylate cyclase
MQAFNLVRQHFGVLRDVIAATHDYFGRTVNLAARVQGLAAENEIYLSDEMYRLPGAADLLTAMQCEARTVHVKGIAREIVVHALRARPQRPAAIGVQNRAFGTRRARRYLPLAHPGASIQPI